MISYGVIVWLVTLLLAFFTLSNLLHMLGGKTAGVRAKGFLALIVNVAACWILYQLASTHHADVLTELTSSATQLFDSMTSSATQ